MNRFALVRNGEVITVFETVRPKSDFPDIAAMLAEVGPEVRQGWFRHPDGSFAERPFRTLDEAKAEARARIAEARWVAEGAGVEFSGFIVTTDDRAKLMLSAATVKATRNPTFTTQWKTAGGRFVMLNSAQIVALFDAVSNFVDGLFKREATLAVQIDAAQSAAEADTVNW